MTITTIHAKTLKNDVFIAIRANDEGAYWVECQGNGNFKQSASMYQLDKAVGVFDLWVSRWQNIDLADEVNFYEI